MIILDGYKEFAGKDKNMANGTLDMLDFNNIRGYIGIDEDGDYYVFTDSHIHSEGISEEEADEIISEDSDSELIKIVNIIR